jgi:predicted RNA binding protein YcfA (HicA-like mRNA interferase family)
MSEIDYSILRSLTAHEVCRALERDGFTFTRQRGSHHRYAHPDGRRVTVPFTRSGDTFAPGTLRSILERQAHWTADDLRRLGLIQ